MPRLGWSRAPANPDLSFDLKDRPKCQTPGGLNVPWGRPGRIHGSISFTHPTVHGPGGVHHHHQLLYLSIASGHGSESHDGPRTNDGPIPDRHAGYGHWGSACAIRLHSKPSSDWVVGQCDHDLWRIVRGRILTRDLVAANAGTLSRETLDVLEVFHDEPGDGGTVQVGDVVEVGVHARRPTERDGHVFSVRNREKLAPVDAEVVAHLVPLGPGLWARGLDRELAVVRKFAYEGEDYVANLSTLAMLVDPGCGDVGPDR